MAEDPPHPDVSSAPIAEQPLHWAARAGLREAIKAYEQAAVPFTPEEIDEATAEVGGL